MPPEQPPVPAPPASPDDQDRHLDRLFSAMRDIVGPTSPGRRAAILAAVRDTRRRRPAAPSLFSIIGSGLVQLLNLAASAAPRHRSVQADRPRDAPEDDHDQP